MKGPLANIDKEVEAFFANTSKDEVLRLWRETKSSDHEGGITVSEYIALFNEVFGEEYDDVGSPSQQT